jgi:hypothetical protein
VEQIAEVGWVHKTAFRRDLAERVVGHQQEALSTLDAPSHHILMWRTAKTLFEYPIEPIGGELQHPNEIHHSDGAVQIGSNVPLDAARLPRCHDTAPECNRLPFRSNRLLFRTRLIHSDRSGLTQGCSPASRQFSMNTSCTTLNRA